MLHLVRTFVLSALFLAVLAPAAPAAVERTPALPTATGFGGSAATVDPYATQVAINVLRRGGNAVDAAVAAAAVLGVVEPYSAGIGGGGFMVVRSRKGKVRTIDGREFAPRRFEPDSFIDPATGQPIPFAERVTSGLGVGVPGTLRTWQNALDQYGTRPLRRLLRPAIRIARQGYEVDPTFTQQTTDNQARFADFTSTSELYLPGGRPPAPGTTHRNPDLAATYELIARRGVNAFYEGPLARDIVRTVQAPPVREGATRRVRGGLMETEDLAAYFAKWRKPTRIGYRGLRVYGMAPPSSGGTTVSEILNIMEARGAPATDAVLEMHRFIEASKLSFADRNAYVGDPDFVEVPTRCLLLQPFADGRASLIGESALPAPQKAGTCTAEQRGASRASEGPSTTHLTVADRKGNVVAYTFTIESTGGSGIVVPGRGFLLNNELTDFEPTPGLPNSPEARKRPRSSISPTIVTRGRKNRPVLALGSPGGATIITTVAQILINRLERGMTLPEAIADPRVSQRNGPRSDAEPTFVNSSLAAGLRARGHEFNQVPEIGAATGSEFLAGGRQQAGAEAQRRGGGSAMVVRTGPRARPR